MLSAAKNLRLTIATGGYFRFFAAFSMTWLPDSQANMT
jgi:hypothetical protein